MRPSTLSHFVLNTHQPDVLMRWYLAFLDAEVVIDSPDFKAITYDTEHHRLAFSKLREDKKMDRSRPGLMHIAFTYPSMKGLLRHYEQVRDHLGDKPFVAVDHGLTLSLYYRDPDGGNVECFIDRHTGDAAAEFIKTEVFRKNPAGMDIDCEELLARLEAGATEEELMLLDEERFAATDPREIAPRVNRLMLQ